MTHLRSRALALALAVVIFAAGCVVGILVDRTWLRPHHDAWDREHAEHFERFRAHLDLTDDQAIAVKEIVDRTRAEAEAIHAAQGPAFRALHDRAHEDILNVLTPEQADQYRRMIERFEHGRQHRPHFSPPHDGP